MRARRTATFATSRAVKPDPRVSPSKARDGDDTFFVLLRRTPGTPRTENRIDRCPSLQFPSWNASHCHFTSSFFASLSDMTTDNGTPGRIVLYIIIPAAWPNTPTSWTPRSEDPAHHHHHYHRGASRSVIINGRTRCLLAHAPLL